MNVGILGGGQLGWMTILEGRKLGLRFLVLDENPQAPASRVADRWFPPEELNTFYREADIITYEFEHIKEDILHRVEDKLLPGIFPIKLKHRRSEEKRFLYRHGYPVAPFRVGKLSRLRELVSELGPPVIVKSEKLGYDGKGQYRINSLSDLEEVFRNHSQEENFVVEKFVDFEMEVSAIGVRSRDGKVKIYPLTGNFHERGILLYNRVIGTHPVEREIRAIVYELMEDLSITGLLAVEFFFTRDGKVLVNEFAPRPHNTGHYTLDGTCTSQFENLLRAILGLPLGSTRLTAWAGMVNILGLSLEDISLEELLSVDGAKLYWYGKEKRERRKMGHVNVLSRDEKSLVRNISRVLVNLYHREYQTL